MTYSENRRAKYDYEWLDDYEAGIVLTGSEVKSIISGGMSIAESYAEIVNGECFLINSNIEPCKFSSYNNHDPKRIRKLLLHKSEIIKLSEKISQKGLTLVPYRVYSSNGKIKINLKLSRGKKSYDKRQTIKEREWKIEENRLIKG